MVLLSRAGNLPRMRLTGMLAGMKEIMPSLENTKLTFLDGDGVLATSFTAVRKHLKTSRGEQFLIGAVNDPAHWVRSGCSRKRGKPTAARSWDRMPHPKDAPKCANRIRE